MNTDIFTKIKERYDNFSKVNKILADYVLEKYSTIAFMSIQELSEKANVSTASITRFSKELDYSGFPAFQKEIQGIIKKEMIDRKEIRELIQENNSIDVLSEIINDNIDNLSYTLTDELSVEFNKAVKAISKGKNIYIVGLRSSYTVAYYFYFLLREVRGNVFIITPGVGDVYDQLASVNNDDVLVAISFPNYTKITCQIVEFFVKQKAQVISVTDTYSSPIAVLSDITLISVNRRNAYSFASALSIMNAIVVSIGKLNSNKTIELLDRKKEILKEMEVHI